MEPQSPTATGLLRWPSGVSRYRSGSADEFGDPQGVGEELLRGLLGGLVAGDVVRAAEVVANAGVGLGGRVDAEALVEGAVEVEDADLSKPDRVYLERAKGSLPPLHTPYIRRQSANRNPHYKPSNLPRNRAICAPAMQAGPRQPTIVRVCIEGCRCVLG